MARYFAAAISHAPGFSGIFDSGHCSSAATSTSCARSSASPISFTIRISPAMSLGDSILQTVSIVRCISVAITATDHTTSYFFNATRVVPSSVTFMRLVLGSGPPQLAFRRVHLPNLGLALPARPVLLMKLHEPDRRLDRFFLGFQVKLRVAAYDLLGLGERSVTHGDLSAGKPPTGARCG